MSLKLQEKHQKPAFGNKLQFNTSVNANIEVHSTDDKNYDKYQHRGEAVLRKHLRRKLRTFEENQISSIIRRTKGKRTLLKFRELYKKIPKKYPKGYA